MPIATRTFRVFVSSTFEDLKAERDALQREVFPKLRTLCEQHGARFQAIDLRWGVRDEAGLDQQTMEICLREIERCQRTGVKPNFIVLLGDRYGWQPLPPRIPASEFDALRPHIPVGDATALADQWYRLDENAVPAEYCLQPRTGEFVDPAGWNRVEQTLHQALAQAARAASLPETALIKYEASATHQEILAGLGLTEADRQHVFAFFRRPTVHTAADRADVAPGSSPAPPADNHPGAYGATPPESGGEPLKNSPPQMRRGGAPSAGVVLRRGSADHDSANKTLRSLKSPAFGDRGEDEAPSSRETDARLEDLKSYLRRSLPGNIADFDPGDTAKLCDDVYTRLKQVIEAEVKRFQDRPALDLEVEAHDRFAEERCRIFTGRESVLKTIADYLRGEERRPMVLHGESGSGKSAVMAKASQLYKGPGRLIRRFIGASPQSASGHALLMSLCQEIAPGEVPVDYAQLENAFKERLKVATAEQPLVLFIDALDQLSASDPAREATWLPPELPPHVKVLVSTTVIPQSREATDVAPGFSPAPATFGDRGEVASAGLKPGATPPEAEGLPTIDERERMPEGLPVRLERMAQPEGGQALDELLQDAGRKLQPWQRATVLTHFERCGLPLYLKLAAEESRLWKSHALENACKLGEGVPGVIDTLFNRLSSNANHGPTMVERSLGYLAAARYGLTEDEILDVLTEDVAVWKDFNERKHHEVSERRLPVVVWSRLSLDLEPYLTERTAPGGAVITFYHHQLAERVAGRFLAGDESQARHRDLALYFSVKPAWLDEGRKTPNSRRVVELPFQQRGAQQWNEAESTLFDCQFLFAKCAAGLVLDLDADYQALFEEAPESSLPHRDALKRIDGAVRLSAHVIERDPRQFASQLLGRLLSDRWPRVQELVRSAAEYRATPWLKPKTASLTAPGGPLVRVLAGHSGGINAVAMTLDRKRAVSASYDQTLKVWDLESGKALQTLAGHSSWVNAVAVTLDGKRAVSASYDQTLKVWDLASGKELQTLAGHGDEVNAVAVTPDGKRAVSASDDQTLKVWDLESAKELQTLVGHSEQVTAVAVTPNGKRAVSASLDHTLKVWDLASGKELQTLAGHSDSVNGVAVTPDGKRAVSGSCDKTLKVWDLESGKELRTLAGHSDRVSGVAVTPDGKRAVSASWDHTLKVWDLASGKELQTLAGHISFVNGVAVTPDGKRAVSASSDQTLKVWDLASGKELQTLAGHSDGVTAVAVTAKRKRAVSASGDETLKVWDFESGKELQTLAGHSDRVNAVRVTADGRRVVSASSDRTLKVWDLDSEKELQTLAGHSDRVTAVALTPDGKRAVSASDDRTLKVWDLRSGKELHTLAGHSYLVNAVRVTADGKRVVSASNDETLKVWDLESGKELQTLTGHSSFVNGVAVTPDGKRAVSASWDRTLKVWDLESGKELHTLAGHSNAVTAVALTPDGKFAVSASSWTLKVWDLESGKELQTLAGHSHWVNGVAVTPDGKRAVSASDDCTLRVWDLETGKAVAAFTADASLRACAVGPDGRVIVAGDTLGRVHFLTLEV